MRGGSGQGRCALGLTQTCRPYFRDFCLPTGPQALQQLHQEGSRDGGSCYSSASCWRPAQRVRGEALACTMSQQV